MAYAKDGYPTELANKVGHIKLINDPMIQRMIESFEDHRSTNEDYPPITGHLEFDGNRTIEQVITVDGGHQAVPNIARPERQVGFIQIAAQMVKLDTIESLRTNPMMDPRKVRPLLNQFTHHTLVALPLSGVHIPGLTVRQSIRETIHRFISHYELYDALSYLVYFKWLPQMPEAPSMQCLKCGESFELPRNEIKFTCPKCREEHTLSDYLGLVDQDADERSSVETVSNLRAVLEALLLFSFVIRFKDHDAIMGKTLFLLDGPLTLRAQLARLVEPIRALICHQRDRGKLIFIAGIEKGGELSSFAQSYAPRLSNVGDYFIPTSSFVVEEIYGRTFDASTYRNRVNYGAKAVVRIGKDHVLALNVPTGDYILEPRVEDLIGFSEIVQGLSRLVSYSHDNALIPVVLANNEASISNKPSGGLLAQFVDHILAGEVQMAKAT